MKSHMQPRGRHGPPFLLIGLVVVAAILGFNYWHSSSQLQVVNLQLNELQHNHGELAAQKLQLESTNEVLEKKLKHSEYTYETFRQTQEKKDEEMTVLSENLKQMETETKRRRTIDDKRIGEANLKLQSAMINASKLLEIHQKDEDLIRQLREENNQLNAQLAALPKSEPEKGASATDCNVACLAFAEAAQQRLFKKVEQHFGIEGLELLKSSDMGMTKKPGTLITGPPMEGKLAPDILVVDRDGKRIKERTGTPLVKKTEPEWESVLVKENNSSHSTLAPDHEKHSLGMRNFFIDPLKTPELNNEEDDVPKPQPPSTISNPRTLPDSAPVVAAVPAVGSLPNNPPADSAAKVPGPLAIGAAVSQDARENPPAPGLEKAAAAAGEDELDDDDDDIVDGEEEGKGAGLEDPVAPDGAKQEPLLEQPPARGVLRKPPAPDVVDEMNKNMALEDEKNDGKIDV